MTKMNNLVTLQEIGNHIFTIRGVQVMLDSHLAELYGVETRIINQAVKRNLNRFPETFRFQVSEDEYDYITVRLIRFTNLKSQFVISSPEHGGRRKRSFVFTEQGVAMLSAVLRSETAVKVSIQIIEAFVRMRKVIADNAVIFHRLDKIDQKILEADEKFEQIFDALQTNNLEPKQGIFFDGQVFDAYSFVADLVRKASKSIILIDNYIDDTVLTLFKKRNKGVSLTIYTKDISKQMELDIKKFNDQYEPLQIVELKEAHDRFLIIDENGLYHFGASLKDLGKKWFAFSKIDSITFALLEKLKAHNKNT